ncbi:MAG: cupredoxin domain-containing protein [Alphaproteobacteria bacterium]
MSTAKRQGCRLVIGVLSAMILVGGFAYKAEAEELVYELNIVNHHFVPAELKVPSGQAFFLQVKNTDATPEEFESHPLKIEKIIPAGVTSKIRVRALDSGEYKFFGEFNEKTAQGVIIAE